MLLSPLRYPGGKAKLYDYFGALISHNRLFDRTYCEPYAGGAGLALRLLSTGFVPRIALNDIDPSIFSFWRAVLGHTEKLCSMVESVPVTIAEWHRQKAIWKAQDFSDELALGFATFFLNRTNRSGIIEGAGPIGGYAQDGLWRLDVRFNKRQLVSQLRAIATYKRQISVSRLDAIDFATKQFSEPNTLCYLDPPYYIKGSKLYRNYYIHDDHCNIRNLLYANKKSKWVISYDDASAIRNIYNKLTPVKYSLKYSAGEKATGNEIIYFSDTVIPPPFAGFILEAA